MNAVPRPYLPVEQLFDSVVAMSGGERVDELLEEPPDWDNADYIFQEDGVVVELKEIQKDLNADRELSQRIGDLHYKHRDRLGIMFGRHAVRIDQLPDDIRDEMIVPFQRRFERPVKKAAKQVKETKARLSPKSCGLFVLVNDASTFLTPEVARFFFSRILSNPKQHSAIDHVIYCSVNMLLQTEEVPEGACFWWDSPVSGRRQLPSGFVERLCANWKRASDECPFGKRA